MKNKIKKSAQDIQDDIFRKMTPDKKIDLGSRLWLLARELSKEKIYHGINRSKAVIGKNS